MSRTFLILSGAFFIILGAAALYATQKMAQAPSSPVITEPVAVVDVNWQTYSDGSVSFRYPAVLSTTYIHSVDWPPKVAVSEGAPTCAEITTIRGHSYCVTTSSGGAAGSVYIDYAYAVEKDGKTALLSFTLREVQCANYDDPEKTTCEQERNTFDVNALADSIMQTVTLK
jgi:hypothetical protein